MARAITSGPVLSASCTAGTGLDTSYAFIQEKGINVTVPFCQTKKVSHTANEWGKEGFNLGSNLKPMLLTTMYNKNNAPWKIDPKRSGSERCLFTHDCSKKKFSPGIPVGDT